MLGRFNEFFLSSVGLDFVPWRNICACFGKHLVLVVEVLIPTHMGVFIVFFNFPLCERIGFGGFEAPILLLLADGEIEFDQDDARVNDKLFKIIDIVHEARVFAFGAQSEHGLNDGAVVPAAVEEDHFTGVGQLLCILLEIPLAGRFILAARHMYLYAVVAWIVVAQDGANDSTLLTGITSVK